MSDEFQAEQFRRALIAQAIADGLRVVDVEVEDLIRFRVVDRHTGELLLDETCSPDRAEALFEAASDRDGGWVAADRLDELVAAAYPPDDTVV